MWYVRLTLLVVCCALAEGGAAQAGVALPEGEQPWVATTTRAPLRTLDRQAAELAWRSWLQSPESGNQNAPPRRITTKSLFIPPLVCPKGQRLDRNGCVQVVTVNKDEHERILLEQLNAVFTPSTDVVYDYGDEEPGPLQLSIPIGLDPQAAPLQANEPSAQAQDEKMKNDKPKGGLSIEAELELLKLVQKTENNTNSEDTHILNHNILSNFPTPLEKPKRDSQTVNISDSIKNVKEEGQKEIVFGHVNVDPVAYGEYYENRESNTLPTTPNPDTASVSSKGNVSNSTLAAAKNDINTNDEIKANATQISKKDSDRIKLNPENDYADIGEAIKLISRYAEVRTDDDYTKTQKQNVTDDSILGTRTKLQYRRNKFKSEQENNDPSAISPSDAGYNEKSNQPIANNIYYRYPWQSHHLKSPPPDYPFRHLQDYWHGRNPMVGLYNSVHENPRRHHHSYSYNNNYGSRSNSFTDFQGPYQGIQSIYAGQHRGYAARPMQHHRNTLRGHTNNRDLYSLLGLRHWFSTEGTSKR